MSPPVSSFQSKATDKQMHQTIKPTNQEQKDGIMFRGICELKTNNSRERYDHDLKQMKEIAKYLKKICNFIDMKSQSLPKKSFYFFEKSNREKLFTETKSNFSFLLATPEVSKAEHCPGKNI